MCDESAFPTSESESPATADDKEVSSEGGLSRRKFLAGAAAAGAGRDAAARTAYPGRRDRRQSLAGVQMRRRASICSSAARSCRTLAAIVLTESSKAVYYNGMSDGKTDAFKRAGRLADVRGFGIDSTALAADALRSDWPVLRMENLDTDLPLPPEAETARAQGRAPVRPDAAPPHAPPVKLRIDVNMGVLAGSMGEPRHLRVHPIQMRYEDQ